LKGDSGGMQREVAAAHGKSGAEELISDHQAFALAYTGHLQEATKMLRRASDLAQQAAHREKAAGFETRAALWEAFYGNAPAAKPMAMAALALAKNREVQYGAALALAMAGDSSQAQTLANDLESSFPEDTSVKFNYLPVRACVSCAEPWRFPQRRSNFSKWPFPMNWASRAALKRVSSGLSIPSMHVVRRIWPHAKALRPPGNFRKFWITPG
jgi:hypothetical protein